MNARGTPSARSCSKCGKDAILTCKACKGMPDSAEQLTAVYYCSPECQKSDWEVHKPKCKASRDRQVLFRAGDIAQRLLIIFLRNKCRSVYSNVVMDIGRIHWQDIGRLYVGKMWRVHYGTRTPDMTNYLIPFEIEPALPMHSQESILTKEECRTAMFVADHLIKDLLQGMKTQIREICLRIKNPCMMQTSYEPDKTAIVASAKHSIFKITLSNGENYALDPTATQYGWYGSSIMPWSIFARERLDAIIDSYDRGGTTNQLRAEAEGAEGADLTWRCVLECMKSEFDDALFDWQRRNKPFNALLKCTEETFQHEVISLLEFMNEHMVKVQAEVNKRLVLCCN